MHLFIFNLFSCIRARDRSKHILLKQWEPQLTFTFPSSSQGSLYDVFPTSAPSEPHHRFSHAVILPKWSLSSSILPTGYPAHPAQVSPNQTSHSANPKLVVVPPLQGHWDCKRSPVPMSMFRHRCNRGGSHQAGGKSLFIQLLLSCRKE